ncbi:hypothetical protein [Actinomadura rupiterrae]|uniref:hypothetical protein n=1 Tax=Actinomadura rupiterrae TaxID=559627 RepID=UPI0020A5174C|nr:hypothetical protein [Actinomadura rupiterrae]MCP2341946.1 hypothetical protein [Actinomadura rupiterrae]
MGFNGFYLLYVPIAVAFVAFVVYGGLVMPAKEMRDSLRHDRPRGPDTPDAPDAEFFELQHARSDRKAAA